MLSLRGDFNGLLSPVRGRILLACVLQAVASVLAVVPFIAVAELGRVLLEPVPDEDRAWTIAVGGVLAVLGRFFCASAASVISHLAENDLQLALRRRIAHRLSRVPLGWFTERNSADVKRAVQDDVGQLHHLVGHSLTDLVAAIVSPLTALVYLAVWFDWRFSLIAVLPLLSGIAIIRYRESKPNPKQADLGAAVGRVTRSAIEFVQGIAVIKTFGQTGRAYDRYREAGRGFTETFWELLRIRLSLNAASELIMAPLTSLVLVMGVGLWFVSQGWLSAAGLLAFVLLTPGLTSPVLTVLHASGTMRGARAAAGRIDALLQAPVLQEAEAVTAAPAAARVVFEGVRFSYDGTTNAVEDIDLVLEPGTMTALVGSSGSGKSTLLKLLLRFWDPSSGRIRLGGVDLRDLSSSELYRWVSFVSQDAVLLRTSIRDNIRLGRPGASEAEVEAAARAAQVHNRILALEGGYDAVAGEGAHLSGGELQRVSIARALLQDAPILLLDEATAFADAESEAAIQDAISVLAAGRTVLLVAHRLSTIEGVNQIAVMQRGQIVERGGHQELLEHDGTYARLWRLHEKAHAGHHADVTGASS